MLFVFACLVGLQQQIQIAALQAQLSQQQRSHNLDPRVQPVRGLYSSAGIVPVSAGVVISAAPQGRGIFGSASMSPATSVMNRALTSHVQGNLQSIPTNSKKGQ